MKKSDLTFGALLVPIDFILLVTAGLLAYAVRFSRVYTEYIKEATVIIQFSDYVPLVLFVSLGWLVIFAIAGMYRLRTNRSIWDEFAKVFMASSTGILAVVIYIFLNRELFASRFIVLAAWLFAILLVSLGRIIARNIQRRYLEKGIGVHQVLLVGNNEIAEKLSHIFSERPGMGYAVVEQFHDFKQDKARLLDELLKTKHIDEVILADALLPQEEKYILLDRISEHHLDFRYAADVLGWLSTSTTIDTLAGIPLIEVRKTPLEGWGRIIKRVFDVIASGLLIIVSSPILAIVSVTIKLESKGNVLYKSHRIGSKGKPFYLLKFRSMVEGAEALRATLQANNERQGGPLFKMKDDPRVTKIGKFIRRWSIDELPQLWNVFIGEISLVGPRPHEVGEVAQYQKHHKRLLDIKPGVTGFSQVAGRSDLDFEDEVRLDTYYIEHWSLWLDIKILLQTPKAVLTRRKAE